LVGNSAPAPGGNPPDIRSMTQSIALDEEYVKKSKGEGPVNFEAKSVTLK